MTKTTDTSDVGEGIQFAIRFLGLYDDILSGEPDKTEENFSNAIGVGAFPSDAFGQLLWRFPALRCPKIFELGFGITQFEAIAAVRQTRAYGVVNDLDPKYGWAIWSLAILLSELSVEFDEREVDDWLAGEKTNFHIPAATHLGSPVGRDLIRRTLMKMKARSYFGGFLS
jgi:hypothetical protein